MNDILEAEETAALAVRIKRECKNHDVLEIGVALTSVLVDFAMCANMDKQELIEIVSGTWDITLEDMEVKH